MSWTWQDKVAIVAAVVSFIFIAVSITDSSAIVSDMAKLNTPVILRK